MSNNESNLKYIWNWIENFGDTFAGRHAIVELLAQNGANVNLKVNDDLTVLNLSALHGTVSQMLR